MFRPVPAVLAAVLLASLAPLALADDARLGYDVRPTFQEVRLRLDAREADYSGSTTLTLAVDHATDRFRFHAENMDLVDVTLTGADGTVYDHVMTDGEIGLRELTFAEPLAPGEYTLEITFTNDFDTTAHGLYRLDWKDEGYAFTQFESDDAREAFPCFDEPAFKQPWRMILSTPVEHLAVANTLPETEVEEDGWRTTTFAVTRPLPSYLLAIATGPLETVDIPDMPVPARVVTVQGSSGLTGEAVKSTPPILRALEAYFDSGYPYDKLDLIGVPEYWPGAMENPGAITYAEGILLIDPASPSPNQVRRLAEVTAHEIAHMWYGDVVTMEWWDDLWLNESFASWMGNKITDQVYPAYEMSVRELRGRETALGTDAQVVARAIRQPVLATDNLIQAADALAYQKGQAVLGMVELWLGEDAFRQGVLAYIDEHRWGNARAEDLWSALAAASDKPVTECMASFLDQPGFPLVSVEPLDGGRVRISQTRFLNEGAEVEGNPRWLVPVGLRWADDAGVHTRSVLLQEPETIVDLGVEGDLAWLHPNVDERGYYRWWVPSEDMAVLAASETEMSVRERVGFLQNLGGLLAAGRIAGDDYLRFLGQFAEDPHPEVVNAMLGGLGLVEGAFVTPDLRDAFGVYVRRTLAPAAERFGLEAREGEPETVSMFRPTLLTWLGTYGQDESVLAYAEETLPGYLEDPSSVDPAIAGTVVNLAARRGDHDLWTTYRERFETATVPAQRSLFLGALGRFLDPALQDSALAYIMTGPLRPQEVFSIPFGLATTTDDPDKIWNWTKANYDALTSRMPPLFKVYMPYFGGGCREGRTEDLRAFFSEDDHRVTGVDKELDKVTEGIDDCVSLRKREGPAVKAYLEEVQAYVGEMGSGR